MSGFRPLRNTLPAACNNVRSESEIEAKMAEAFVRNKKFTFVKSGDVPQGEGLFIFPQYEIKPYRLDYLIHGVGYFGAKRIWPPTEEVKICVECDGAEFHTSPEQKARDKKRDEYLLTKGIKTHRYSGSEIYRYADNLVKDIAAIVEGAIFRGSTE